MLKKLIFLLVSIFMLGLPAGCRNSDDAADAKILRVGCEPTFAPFEFGDSGSYEGFDMDLIRAAGERAGFKVEIRNMGFDALIPALKAGSIDLIASGMTITPERRQEVLFTAPYYTSGLGIVVAKDNAAINSFKDLEGKRIAVPIGTSGENKARTVPGATVVTFNTNTDAVLELENGAADAVINDRPVLAYYLSKSGTGKCRILSDIMEAEQYGFAIAKDNTKLAAKINAALASLAKDGGYAAIYKKWFGEWFGENGIEAASKQLAEEASKTVDSIAAEGHDRSILEFIAGILPLLLAGAGVTVEISAISVGLGLVLGCLVGIARICQVRWLRWAGAVYVDFLRGTPLLVQIFLVYFALPQIIGTTVNPFAAAIIACSINSGAYIAEIFRAGIQSIDKGQMEAGRCLGLSWGSTMRHIIIPQAFRRIIPPLGNEFIAMLKDSSLVSVIGFEELTRCGQLVIARTYASFEVWMAVAIIYLAMTLAVSRLVSVMERKFVR